MPQPDPYRRQYPFAGLAPADYPEVGARLDAEVEGIADSINEIISRLGSIQRDDGRLANQSVGPDTLSARVRAIISGGWALRGTWAAATAYVAKDVVRFDPGTGAILYVALEAHTAGVFATDLAAGRWLPWYQEAQVPASGVITEDMLAGGFLLPFAKLGSYTAPGTGAVARTAPDRLAEWIFATDFGADRNGLVGAAAALEAAGARAEAVRGVLVIPHGTFKLERGITFPAATWAGILQFGTLSYAGAGSEAAVTIGTDNATAGAFNQSKQYRGLRVLRAAQSNWTNEADIGFRIINCDNCDIEVLQAEKFTIGVQLYGGLRGCEDSRFTLGRLIDNKVALDLRTFTAAGWVNSNSFRGGHFACASATNPLLDRFGVRLSNEVGAYDRHNANRFTDPSFELQRQGTPGTVNAIPFLVEAGDARALEARGIRMEACSPFVARHTGGAQDCLYEVGYSGTYGPYVTVDYSGTATRAGGTAIIRHQSTVAHHTPRLIADAGDVRRLAYRENSTSIGFEGMAVLSSNPSGPPTTLSTLAFPGLSGFTLNTDDVTVPTSRAVGFVIRLGDCREIMVGADGDILRLVVQQYDAAGNVLDGTNRVLLSNGGCTFAASPTQWWEGTSNIDALTGGIQLNRLQRVTLAAGAAFAFIGVRGGTAAAVLRALRLYSPGDYYPQVFTRARAAGVNGWGQRELTGTFAAWLAPDLAAGATAQLTATTASQVLVTGARQGDAVQVGYTMSAGSQNGGIVFAGSVSVADRVSVSIHNQSAGTIQLDGGSTNTVDLFVTVTKPRL